MTRRTVDVRAWPGLDGWKSPSVPPVRCPRLGERIGLVIVGAANAGGIPEEFGLGAYLDVVGRSIRGGGIIVPDDLDSATVDQIGEWAAAHPMETTAGRRAWSVVTVPEFCHPRTGRFVKVAYSGAGWCVGADLGRFFGLIAEHWGGRTGRNVDGWEVWLPGWGKRHEHGRWKRRSPHRPPLWVKARRVGWQVEFAPCTAPHGKWVGGRIWRGAFLDVLSLAYALDGDRSANFSERRVNVDLEPADLPISVTRDAPGATRLAEAVLSIHELAITLDERSSAWFTSPTDRTQGRGRLDLARTVSPGTIATGILTRAGVRAPLDKFDLRDDEHRAWAETFHGGWTSAHWGLLGTAFEAVSLDVSSCFPLVAHLIGWWPLMCGEELLREVVTDELQRMCERAIDEPGILIDPAVWRRFGLALVEGVRPDGEYFPVEVEDKRRPDGRLEFLPLFSPNRPFTFSALNVLATSVQSRRVPQFESATAYVPNGCQERLRPNVPLLPGLSIDIKEDPVLILVRHRRDLKLRGDLTDAAQLRVLVNSLVFGNPARFDERRRKVGGEWMRTEVPGPFNFLPLASSVTAGSHLLLALFDRLMTDRGGIVAYRDTDSSIVPVGNGGQVVETSDGTEISTVAREVVGEIVDAFEPLSPDSEWPIWKVEDGTEVEPRCAVIFGPKRHAEFEVTENGPRLIDHAEVTLGGYFADPSGLPGREPDGHRIWSRGAAEQEVALAVVRQRDPDAVRPVRPWDVGGGPSFPALRRLVVKTPEMATLLPDCLGPRPGTRYIDATVSRAKGECIGAPVALDPGGGLSDWDLRLRFVDRSVGEPVRVTTDPTDHGAILLDTLDNRAVEWTRPPRSAPLDEIVVDPYLLRTVGRVSGVIDAEADGLADLVKYRRVFDEADAPSFVLAEIGRLGVTVFSRRYGIPGSTVQKIKAGRSPGAITIARVLERLDVPDGGARFCQLDGCVRKVVRPNARYCSPAHRNRASRLRRRAQGPKASETEVILALGDVTSEFPRCPGCGAELLGVAARRGTCRPCSEEAA